MIDVVEYQKRLEQRLLMQLVKLDEPMDTNESWHVAMEPTSDDYRDDFDMFFWEPAVFSLLKAFIVEGIKEFYCADVYYEGDVLVINVSRGDLQRS